MHQPANNLLRKTKPHQKTKPKPDKPQNQTSRVLHAPSQEFTALQTFAEDRLIEESLSISFFPGSSGSAEGWLRTKIIVLSMLTRLAVIELLKALHKAGVTLTLENDRAATAFHRGYIETIAVY